MEMQRRKRKTAKAVVIWALVFCLGITSASFADHGDNPEDVRLYAQSAVLMDGKSGRDFMGAKRRNRPSHGKYYKDYDLYSGAGSRTWGGR